MLVVEITQEQLPENYIHDERLILPRCVARISYTLTPDIPSDSFHMMDCAKGDRPVKRKSENEKELSKSSCDVASVGIIGGTDGPTAIIYTSRTSKKQLHNAYSAVHFEPVENIEWRMVFRKKMREDVVVEIQLNE